MQIHELSDEMTSIADAGNYLAVDNGVVTAKIDYLRLAKAIIEVYNGSSINGSNQTLQTAMAGLQEQIDDSLIVSSTYADFYTKCTALPNMKPVTFHCEGAVTSVITGGDVALTIKGIIEKSDVDTNRFDFFGYDGQGYMYAYRVKFVSSSEVVVQARKSTKTLETDISTLNTKVIFGTNNTAVRLASNKFADNSYASMQFRISATEYYELLFTASNIMFRKTNNGGQSYTAIWTK